MNIFKIIVLVLSGLALIYACSMRLINPTEAVFLQTYFEQPTHNLEIPMDLVNEIRGIGTVMLLGGIIAFLGAIQSRFRQTAFVVLTTIFAGIILGRSISFFIDGIPHPNLMRAAIAEAILAAFNVFCLIYRSK